MPETNALLLWQKIRISPEISDVDEALRCEIYDPLWMLGRQWQMGEFKAEDAGMAAFAAVQTAQVKPQLFQGCNNKESFPYDPDTTPLNVQIESIPVSFTLDIRIETANELKNMLTESGKTGIWKKLLTNTTLHFQLPPQIYDPENETLLHVADENFELALAALINGRAIDGFLLYQALQTKKVSDLTGLTDIKADETGNQWRLWVEEFMGIKTNRPDSWNAGRLEYRAAIAAEGFTNGNTCLQLPEYHGQLMNLYSWKDATTPASMQKTLPPTKKIQMQNLLPVAVSFPGMPSPRWWAFEDNTIDFSNLKTDLNDIGLLLLSEFGLIYSNDWLIIPYTAEAGSLTEVQRLDITDVFGVQTAVNPVKQDAFWEIFRMATGQPPAIKNALFLPATAEHIIGSEKHEEVHFFRDEMSNLVWAIENIIPNGSGESGDGDDAARRQEDFLRTLAGDEPPSPVPDNPDADYKYQIANTVPANWIPFVPFRVNPAGPAIVFRRAALPRISKNKGNSRIRPGTEILRNNGPVRKLYDINEEEIPMAGITVSQYIRRTRWFDGSVITWKARQKTTGRKPVEGGLQFDKMI